MKIRLHLLSGLALLAGLVSGQLVMAQDYDFEAARRAWERAQDVTSDAQTRVDARQDQVNDAERELNNASREVRSIRQDINRKTDQLRTAENNRNAANRAIDQAQSDKQRLVERNRYLNDLLDRDRATEDRLVDDLQDLNRQIRRVRDRIEEVEDDEAELQRLRNRLRNLRSQRDAKKNELATVRNRIRDCQNELSRNRSTISQINDRVSRLRDQVRSLNRQIRDLEWEITSLRSDLDRAEDREADARSDLADARSNLDFAETNLRIAQENELTAKLYYEEVLDRYNTAIAAARSEGRSQAQEHARREANERADILATTAGNTAGVDAGRNAGNADAVAFAKARGYQFGRASGSADEGLRSYYATGSAQGDAIATSKARAENYPQGYNEQLTRILQNPTTATMTIDITDELPDAPAESSPRLLVPEMKVVGDEASPSFVGPVEPDYRVPAPDRPRVDTPTPDRRHYEPSCGGHDLPDFDRACEDSYRETYLGGFADLYRAEYQSIYAGAFRSRAEDTYRSTRRGDRPAVYQEAAQKGATEQGTLDGFATTLPVQRSEQHAAGVAAFDSYRGTGFLPVLGQVRLIEEFADGNLSPGEDVTLELTVENYGLLNSDQELLQVRLTELNGIELDITLRKLPSIPADTSVVLSGVLQGQLRTIVEESATLSLTAVLERDNGTEEGDVVDQATFTGEIEQPFSITRLSFGDAVAIGEEGSGVLVIANRTELANDATTAAVTSSSPSIVIAEEEVEIPSIPAGESVEIPFTFSPEVTAGGNQPVEVSLSASELAGGEITLSASEVVTIDRKGSLRLCVPDCESSVNRVRVQTNRAVIFPMTFDFHSDRRERGPFVIRKSGVSDDSISASNGSTYSVNLGSWSPGTSDYIGRFGYVFPRALRGTTQWIQVSLYEDGTEIHRLRVPVIVE